MTSTRLDFVDTTMRDGNQSLWGATGLRTGMLLEIAPDLDRVGYRAIDFTTSTHMAVTVRFHKENPWERIRLMKERMPRTPLSFLSTGMRFISWETAHPELMDLSYQLLVRNGIERFMVMDPMNNMQAVADSATAIAAAGAWLIWSHWFQKPDLNNVVVVKRLVARHYVLPADEEPALATVTDTTKLQTPFLKQSQNGDKLLVYQKAARAIIYRPSIDRIIDIGPVSLEAPNTGH